MTSKQQTYLGALRESSLASSLQWLRDKYLKGESEKHVSVSRESCNGCYDLQGRDARLGPRRCLRMSLLGRSMCVSM
ncbi:hypothetical protein E2C01_049690 [Portunus trituberculatus]|uniref:Uncharacterized protein n=1 Tax=Portunus trituberculatus TaxID=210409 RepID=A0A5B7GDV5_PORTR|nr:hypothetical protein [Portunus trituberculatus]